LMFLSVLAVVLVQEIDSAGAILSLVAHRNEIEFALKLTLTYLFIFWKNC